MKAKTLIKKLEFNDVKIWIEDDKVKWSAPKGVITDKVLVQMKDQKPELLVILRDKQRTARVGIQGKNLKKPEKCEIQGDTNKILNDLVGQVQGIIQEVLDENNKKMKDIASVVVPLKSSIQKCDVVIEWDTEWGDPNPSGSPTTPQVNKPDDYDGDQNDEPKIGAATFRSLRLLPERCPDISPYLNKITLGDCLEKLKDIPKNSVDVIVTDPPYGLKFMGKNWDKAVPTVEVWKEAMRVLKPGAFAFVMSIPRQDCQSRMISNLEEAGFKVGFSPIYWTYAQGMTKAHDMSKAIDKKLGAERKKIARNPNSRENCGKGNTIYKSGTVGKTCFITAPATPEAKKLEGSYKGFQPKPAVEVIIVAMKPMDENTYERQAFKNEKGITWMDDCRIPYRDSIDKSNYDKCCEVNGKYETGMTWGGKKVLDIPRAGKRTKDFFNEDGKHEPWNASDKGRFPANLLVCDDVLDDGKKRTQGHWAKTKTTGFGKFGGGKSQYYGVGEKNTPKNFSRFFSLDAWAEKNLPFLIVKKASNKEKGENNNHPTVKPVKLMSYLITMGSRENNVVLDIFAGSGTTCIAAKMLNRKYIGIELDERYHDIAVNRVKAAKPLMAQSQKRNNQIITQIGNKEEKRCHQG